MDFRDAISTDLPAPRDDEPGGLRQDILDELADHLACSYHRELLRGAKPAEARRRAIERFGNPAAVARRLWLDAMKGTIMAQRVLIATCLVMVMACFGVVGLVWSQSNRSAAEVAEANRRLAEVLGQSQAANQEMLRQLQAMAKPAQPTKSADWIPVSFKLTVEKPDGPPAVGYEVVLGRGYGGSSRGETIHRRTDASGLADFGVVQPGDWEFLIHAGKWQATAGLNAVPGTSVVKSVVVPKILPERAQVRVRVDWPKALADRNLVAIAVFRPRPLTYQPTIVWGPSRTVQVACGPGNRHAELSYFPGFRPDRQIQAMAFGNPMAGDEILARNRVLAPLSPDFSTASEGPIEVDEGRYVLSGLEILQPVSRDGGTEYELLTLTGSSGEGMFSITAGGAMFGVHGVPIKPSWRDKLDRFEARPGQVAEWTISVPEEMVRAAEKKLEAETRDVPSS